MFPHALDGDGYPLDGFLRGSSTTVRMLQQWQTGKLWEHYVKASNITQINPFKTISSLL